MAGQVEIVNIALARLGESPIQTLDEGSVPANAAKVVYDAARRSTLRDYPWAFALRRESLARFSEPPLGFRYSYALPTGCLRVLGLRRSADSECVPYEVRGQKVCADVDTAIIDFIGDEADDSNFDAKFVEVFSYKLASELAMSVKSSPELMARYAEMYRASVTQAATLSAREERVYVSDNPYLEARG